MRVCPGVNQLGAHPHAIGAALHATFQYVSNTEFSGNLAQVPRNAALVLHYAGAADDFEGGDLGEVGKNLILYSIGEVSVLFVCTEILERQDGNAFFENDRRYRRFDAGIS